MPIVVIGGHTRSIGKTSVVAGIIAALPDLNWTALKITQYGHGVCSANGEACDCVTADHSLAVSEEKDRSGESDTSRFLVAGATRSWWVRTRQGQLAEAMPRVRKILANAPNAIIESNSILRFLKPDLYLTVLDPQITDFKNSAQTFLDRADAVLLHSLEHCAEDASAHSAADSAAHPAYAKDPAWERVSLKPVLNRPIFRIHPPNYVPAEVVDFVRTKLSLASK